MTTENDGSSEEQTGTSGGGSGSFTKLRSMGAPGERAADRLTEACAKLTAEGADQGLARLRRVDELADQVDFITLNRVVGPERAVEEFSAKLSRRVHRLHSARNTLAVMPLLFTWLALAWASIEYSRELAHHPGRVNKPFLLLWQQHFGGSSISSYIPKFSTFAIWDLALLGLVFVFTVRIHFVEARLTQRQTAVAELIDSAMGDLAVAIGSGLGRAPDSAEEWANSAKRIITDAMDQTKQLATAGREAIERASKDLAKVHTEEREFIETFSQEVNKALSTVQEEYRQFMERTAVEVVGVIEQQLNPLLGKFDGLVNEFGKHHETYRAGVTELTTGIKAMSDSAKVLATSAKDHAKVGVEIGANLAKVAESQRDFADQVTTNVASMDSSAKAMESTAEILRGEVMSGLKDLAGNVTDASRDLRSVQGSLKTTTSALGSSAKALDTTSSALDRITRELRVAAAALSSGAQAGFWRRIFRSRRYAGT